MGAALFAAPLPTAASDRADSARRGAEYLVEHQAADGTFFDEDAPHRVAETVVALVAGGVTGRPVDRAVAAIESAGPDAADRAGEAGLLVLGLVAAGRDPSEYVARLRTFWDDRIGAYDTQQFQNALALLGVVATGEPLPEKAVTFLRLNRCPDGGIPIQVPCGGAGGHVDVTALVLQALAADDMPAADTLRAGARTFLVAAQNDEGGFGDATDAPTSANSTGLALAAAAALGEPPWPGAVDRLLELQQPDGRFRQSRDFEGDSFMATRQAVPGMAGRPYPVQPNAAPPSLSRSEQRQATAATTDIAAAAPVAPTGSSPSPAAASTSSTPSTPSPDAVPLALGRYPTPEPEISPQSVAEVHRDEQPRARPTVPIAIAAALLLVVAWRGARLSRPRGDHAVAAGGGRGHAPVPDG